MRASSHCASCSSSPVRCSREASTGRPAVADSAAPASPVASCLTRASCRFAVSAWALSAAICRSSAPLSSVTRRSPSCTSAPSRTCTRAAMPPLGSATGVRLVSNIAAAGKGREVAEPGDGRARCRGDEQQDGASPSASGPRDVEARRHARGGCNRGGGARRCAPLAARRARSARRRWADSAPCTSGSEPTRRSSGASSNALISTQANSAAGVSSCADDEPGADRDQGDLRARPQQA